VVPLFLRGCFAVTWLVEDGADDPEKALRVASHCGLDGDFELLSLLAPLASKTSQSRRPLLIHDAASGGILPPLEAGDPRSLLFVPLIAFDRILGVLGIGDRELMRPDGGNLHRGTSSSHRLGAQAAIAMDKLFEQVRRPRDACGKRRPFMQTESSRLGEMSAKVAHDRNPLSAVGGFASASSEPPRTECEYAALIVQNCA
jgi:hypothetical protein